MATKPTLPFNFDEIYSYIETKFTDLGYDIQEGSNTMQLVTAMSYLTSMLNANTAVNINETILPLARKRNMVLQDARVLGYEIDHIRSYSYKLTLLFSNEDTVQDKTVIIKKYTEFRSNADFIYYYMGDDIELVIPKAVDEQTPSAESVVILVKEGELTKYTEEQSLTYITTAVSSESELGSISVVPHYFDVPLTNIEEDGLEVFLTYIDEYGIFHTLERWEKSDVFMIEKDTVLDKEFIRLDNIEYRTPRVYFKIGDVGKELREGTIINVNALKSNGPAGVLNEIPSCDSLDAEITGYELYIEGAEEETIASVKKNAPLFHNTANRIITKPDYIAFCNRQALVETSDVWDGHDEVPHRPGHIWFSFMPSNASRKMISMKDAIGGGLEEDTDGTFNTHYLMNILDDEENWYIDDTQRWTPTYETPGSTVVTAYEKLTAETLDSDIFDILETELYKYKVPTLEFHHRNPIYLDFTYNVDIVKYTGVLTKAERNESILDVIDSYFSGYNHTYDVQGNIISSEKVIDEAVENFRYEYFQSNLNKRIDISLTDLMGFNIEMSTTIHLCERNLIINEDFEEYDANEGTGLPEDIQRRYKNELRFHLGIPYENIESNIKEDPFITNMLPQIDTIIPVTDLTDNNRGTTLYTEIYVDFSTHTTDPLNSMTTYYIKSTSTIDVATYDTGTIPTRDLENDDIVGVYRVFYGIVRDIEVILYVIPKTLDETLGLPETPGINGETVFWKDDLGVTSYYGQTGRTGLSEAACSGSVVGVPRGIDINVVYPSPNIKMTRNTIPRLKEVIFL